MSNHHLKILIIFIVTTSYLQQGDITEAMDVGAEKTSEGSETEHILRKLKKKFGPPFGKVQQNLKESLEDIYMTHAELFSKSWEKR